MERKYLTSPYGKGGNKLKSYCTLMACFTPELYVYQNIPRAQRSALAKVRCGTAPINITLGKNNKYLTYVRTCFNCVYVIEGECHVLLD